MVKKPNVNNFNNRGRLVTAVFLMAFVIIVGRLFVLQVVRGEKYRQMAEAQHGIYQKLLPSRGEIRLVDPVTLQTIALATNLKSYLVYAVPQEIMNPAAAAAALANVLQMDAKDIEQKITASGKRYVPIKKQLTDDQQQQIKNLALPGIYFDSEDTRYYPKNSFLSQTLGFVGYKGSQKAGLYGLERYFEKDLAGTAGELVAEGDTSGNAIFGSTRNERPAEDGADLILTIDQSIQFQAESILSETVQKHGADSGTVIVGDPKTGAILALANYPNFDLNQYGKVSDPAVYNNQAVTGNFEPGSVFKAITMAAALDEGKITPQTTYTDTGEIEVDGFKIKNSDHKAHGLITLTQALDESYNTGAIFAKEQIGNQDFLSYVKKFGFGQATGIELPETKGSLDGLKYNIAVNFDTAAFGQGITVTPIQMLQAYMALANKGHMMKPFLVQSKILPDGTAQTTQPKQVAQVISEKAAADLSGMLVDVVENGYGKKAAVPGYYVAGKTGTAQVAGPNGKYLENDNIGSFIGFAPVDNPKFVMLLRVDHPRDADYAESTAVPAWGQLAQFILNYYKIPPVRPTGK